jgi:signal transduction histidine kinase
MISDDSRAYRPRLDPVLQAERRARLLQATSEVGQKVTSILSLDELLPKTVDIICDAYGFYYAGVFLIDESGQWAVLRAGRDDAGTAMVAEGYKLEVGGDSIVGLAISQHQARIALDVGEERVHFKNPYLPHTRSEMVLPLMVGDKVLGAVTIQSAEERAFGTDDIVSLQTMANYLAIAIGNAHLLQELEQAHAELLRTKTFEAIATATGEAIHWVGNKAAPIPGGVRRVREDLGQLLTIFHALLATPSDIQRQHPLWPAAQAIFEDMSALNLNLEEMADVLAGLGPEWLEEWGGLESILEDLDIVEMSANTILHIKEDLIGPVRRQHLSAVTLPDLLNQTIMSMGLPAGIIQTEFAADLPPAHGDPRQLDQVFANLIKNAWEALHASAQPRIVVTAQRAQDPRFVLVHVRDNGPGIPPELLDKIWVSFFTTKGDRGGTGLGLSACMQIVNQSGGKIWVENSQAGAGTTFAVLLPVTKENG